MDEFWIPGHKDDFYQAAYFQGESGGKYNYKPSVGGPVVSISKAEQATVVRVHPDHLKGMDDCVQMATVERAGVLRTLKDRYLRKQPYTYVGEIIISVNPFERLGLEKAEIMDKYARATDLKLIAPHLYAISKMAYDGIQKTGDQSILISGESGAGKTEACKICLSYFTDLAGSSSGIQDRVMQCNPLLEAFGNAKTSRNNNSSRFGKWTQLYFDGNNKIVGAGVTDYLLEKSRVLSQTASERNYHIFYMLMASSSAGKYQLSQNHSDYEFLKKGTPKADGVNDKQEFEEVEHAMSDVTMDKNTIDGLLSVVAGILHCGNFNFKPGANDSSSVGNGDALKKCSSLWKVDQKVLETACVTKKLVVGKDVTVKVLKPEDATSSRNTLCTLIYSEMFSWLIGFLNKVISGSADTSGGMKEIGLLDIAGFESFEVNTWEQITINLSNEHLQNHFNDFVFKKELADYNTEGIATEGISYEANDDVLDVIAGRTGIFNICDDVTKGMKPNDQNFLANLNKNLDKNPRFIADRFNKPQFTLKHYAGEVTYTIIGWPTVKNKNEPPIEAGDVLSNSGNFILKGVGDGLQEMGQQKKTTVSVIFRASLDKLMTRIRGTQPHFIRCIKPNDLKKPAIWDGPKILNQLIFSGAMEAVKIRQQGYPLRMKYEEFVKTYRPILPVSEQKNCKSKSGCKNLWDVGCLKLILDALPGILNMEGKLESKQFQLGKTKVFCRMPAEEALNRALGVARASKVLLIQKTYRGYNVRKKIKQALKLRQESGKWALGMKKLYTAPDQYAYKVCGGKKGMQKKLEEFQSFVKRSTMVKPAGLSKDVMSLGRKLEQESHAMDKYPEIKDSTNSMEIEKVIGALKGLKIAPDVIKELEKRVEYLKKNPNTKPSKPIDSNESKKLVELLKNALRNYDGEGLEKGCQKAEKAGMSSNETVSEAKKMYQNLQDADWVKKTLDESLKGLEGGKSSDAKGTIAKCVGLQAALTKLGVDDEVTDAYSTRIRACQMKLGSLFASGKDPSTADMATVMGLYGDPSKAPCMDTEIMRAKVLPDGSMSQPMDPHGAFSWSNQKLQNPLTKAPATAGGHLRETALACSRNILGWMTDHPVEEKKRSVLAYAVVLKAKSEPILNNEIYAQVMKQLVNNPRKRSELLGWKLLVFICQHAEPQPDFFDYIRAFLLKNRVRLKDDAARKEINAVVVQCQEALQAYASSMAEKQKALNATGGVQTKAVKIWNADTYEIHFRCPRNVVGHGDRKPKTFQVPQKQNVKELAKSCADAFGLLEDDAKLYSLWLLQPNGRMKCLTQQSTPVWSILGTTGGDNSFLYERRVLYPNPKADPSDMVGTNLLCRQVLNKLYAYAIPCKSETLALCAASTLNFRKDFFLKEMKSGQFTEEKLKYCLPNARIGDETEAAWSKMIVKAYISNGFKLQDGATKLEQMSKMFSILNSNLPALYMQSYPAICNSKANPREIQAKQPPNKLYPNGLKVTIAVGITGLEIYQKSERIADARFSKHAATKLMGWGCKHANLSVAFTYSNKKREHVGFSCENADAICDLLDICNKEEWVGDGERDKVGGQDVGGGESTSPSGGSSKSKTTSGGAGPGASATNSQQIASSKSQAIASGKSEKDRKSGKKDVDKRADSARGGGSRPAAKSGKS